MHLGTRKLKMGPPGFTLQLGEPRAYVFLRCWSMSSGGCVIKRAVMQMPSEWGPYILLRGTQKEPNHAQLREYNQERGHANAHVMGHLHLTLRPTKRIKPGTTMYYNQQCGHANALRMGHLHIDCIAARKTNLTTHNCASIIKSVAVQMPLECGALILHGCFPLPEAGSCIQRAHENA